MPKLSVIVPVYKSQEYLSRCIDSILSQEFIDFELILIDDGSPDESPQICDNYAVKDKRVVVLHKENEGVSSARNDGLKMAKGKFVTFIDSDDYIDKFLFQKLINEVIEDIDYVFTGVVMENYTADNIKNTLTYKVETKSYSIKTLFEALGEDFELINISSPWAKLFKRSILNKNNIWFDEKMALGEDGYFNLNYLEFCRKCRGLEYVGYHYSRENNESLFSKYSKNTIDIHEKVYNKMRNLITINDCSLETILKFESMYFDLLIGCLSIDFKNIDKNDKKYRLIQINKVIKNKYIIQNINRYKVSGVKNYVIMKLIKSEKIEILYYMFKIYYSRNLKYLSM